MSFRMKLYKRFKEIKKLMSGEKHQIDICCTPVEVKFMYRKFMESF